MIPILTEERRREITKQAHKYGEEAKVSIRNIRRDAIDHIKKLKDEDLSEDAIKDLEDETQKLTDSFIKKIDSAIEDKSKEVMTV